MIKDQIIIMRKIYDDIIMTLEQGTLKKEELKRITTVPDYFPCQEQWIREGTEAWEAKWKIASQLLDHEMRKVLNSQSRYMVRPYTVTYAN